MPNQERPSDSAEAVAVPSGAQSDPVQGIVLKPRTVTRELALNDTSAERGDRALALEVSLADCPDLIGAEDFSSMTGFGGSLKARLEMGVDNKGDKIILGVVDTGEPVEGRHHISQFTSSPNRYHVVQLKETVKDDGSTAYEPQTGTRYLPTRDDPTPRPFEIPLSKGIASDGTPMFLGATVGYEKSTLAQAGFVIPNEVATRQVAILIEPNGKMRIESVDAGATTKIAINEPESAPSSARVQVGGELLPTAILDVVKVDDAREDIAEAFEEVKADSRPEPSVVEVAAVIAKNNIVEADSAPVEKSAERTLTEHPEDPVMRELMGGKPDMRIGLRTVQNIERDTKEEVATMVKLYGKAEEVVRAFNQLKTELPALKLDDFGPNETNARIYSLVGRLKRMLGSAENDGYESADTLGGLLKDLEWQSSRSLGENGLDGTASQFATRIKYMKISGRDHPVEQQSPSYSDTPEEVVSDLNDVIDEVIKDNKDIKRVVNAVLPRVQSEMAAVQRVLNQGVMPNLSALGSAIGDLQNYLGEYIDTANGGAQPPQFLRNRQRMSHYLNHVAGMMSHTVELDKQLAGK